MNIKSQIILVMNLLIIITALSFSYITYRSAKNTFSEGVDGRLLAAARCAMAILPEDYHDRLTNSNSMSKEAFDQIVDQNNRICVDLGLQYIWSVMLVSNTVVFTSSTSPGKDISKHDYASFFEVHTNPEFYKKAFSTMKVCYDFFDDKWGSGKSVLVPGLDRYGRKHCFGASINTGDVEKLLWKTMTPPLLLAFAVLLTGIGTSFVLAGKLARPIVRLTSIAREIAQGNFDQKIGLSGVNEIESLSRSIESMSSAIKDKLASISESEERFRRIFDEGLIGVVIVGLDTKIARANPAFCRIVGYTQEELCKMTLADITHPDHIRQDSENLKKVAAGEIAFYKTQKRYTGKDGNLKWASVIASAVRNEAGKPLYFLAMVEDISDRKTMEDQLRKSEERFRSLFENMTEGVALNEVVCGPSGKAVDYRIIEINPAYQKHTGIAADRIRGQLASAFYSTEQPPYLDIFAKVAETGEPHHFEMFFAPLKRYFNVAVCSPRKGWFALVFEDITTQKAMNEQLRQNEEKFRTLFENMTEGVALHEIVYDQKGKAINYRITDVNPAYQNQTGITPEMARGKLATELYGTESAPYLPIWAKVAETGKPHHSEVFFGPMKRHFNIAACSPRKGWFATVFTDITEQKQTEENLLQSEEKFRALVETTSDWIWEVDRNGLYIYVSPRIRELLGYEPEELFGKKPSRLSPPGEAQLVEDIMKQHIASHEPLIHFEKTNLHKKGHLVVLETSGAPVYDANGRFTGFRGIDRDITERKKAGEAIHQLNRELEQRVKDRTLQLELANKELRTFAYSVSHDLRAPLRSIDGFSKAILEDYSEKLDAEGRDYLGRIRRASQRMAALIEDLLKLSRVTSGEMHISEANLSQIASNILADLHETDRQRKVETVVMPGLNARADIQLITVALENLLGNSWKFTGRKQNAKIEFGATVQDSIPVYYVRDNGAGFDMAFTDKLFGAFQRLHTAQDYPGDGIGLASVQRIIHRHGGRVWAEGKPNEGATFYFTLG